ncbi:MAG: hypothetical protein VKO00_04350 [Cyanobacteriota bacterium]|nr:hypothetical protein [Cyanobacteriota bacterium]
MNQPPGQLKLPRPKDGRRIFREKRPRRPKPVRQLLMGVVMILLGAALLLALVKIPEQFDALLLVSSAVANLIAGLSRLGMGLLQLAALLLAVLLALLALSLLVGGVVRLMRLVSAAGEPRTRR